MSNINPRTVRLELFSEHFNIIDERLSAYAMANELTFHENVARRPCRECHRLKMTTQIVGIYISDEWTTIDYDDDLPHNIILASYYRLSPGQDFIRRGFLVDHVPFSTLVPNLEELFTRGFERIDSWGVPELPLDKSIKALTPDQSFEFPGWLPSPLNALAIRRALAAAEGTDQR